ncbi:MAG: hypothetical protein K2X46_05370 [Roseomonas sp.]|uniref:hypothetical protein n=1 Tax=Falsiroseomonas sp. TaxID=2870721 RepID=UPI0038F9D69F|nr:hypothetical protein [Roseomonas sp.]
MAARKARAPRPIDAALQRLLALAGRGVAPARMAREVDMIIAEWRLLAEADEKFDLAASLETLREQLDAGVGAAEEQVADVDASEPAAVKQANAMLSALVATRDAALAA